MKRSPIARLTPLKAAKALQRRTPLQSKTELRSTAPLERSSVPLKRAPIVQKRVKPKLTATEKVPLVERAGGWCELQTDACTFLPTDVCHRRGEKAGGRHGEAARANDRLSNVLFGCRACHRYATEHPAIALRMGWRLLENDDPMKARVYRRGRWVLLSDDGLVTLCASS